MVLGYSMVLAYGFCVELWLGGIKMAKEKAVIPRFNPSDFSQ